MPTGCGTCCALELMPQLRLQHAASSQTAWFCNRSPTPPCRYCVTENMCAAGVTMTNTRSRSCKIGHPPWHGALCMGHACTACTAYTRFQDRAVLDGAVRRCAVRRCVVRRCAARIDNLSANSGHLHSVASGLVIAIARLLLSNPHTDVCKCTTKTTQ
jgi:hypothetical protein